MKTKKYRVTSPNNYPYDWEWTIEMDFNTKKEALEYISKLPDNPKDIKLEEIEITNKKYEKKAN